MSRAVTSPSSRDDPKKVALVYVRVSKYAAQDEGRKVSPETQLEKCKALPALNDCQVEVFEDLDYSGKNTRRPGFTQLIERAQRGDVGVVACYSISRLSRDVPDLYQTLKTLKQSGVGFVSATDPLYDTTSPFGEFILGIVAGVAQLERRQTSQRVADALAFKRTRGKLLGTLPAGYERSSDGRIVIDEPIAATIRLVFDMYASGSYSYKTLALSLNDRGVKTISRRGGNGSPAASLWSGDVLKEVLARPTYAGLIRLPDGSMRPGEQPAIVAADVWTRVQAIRQRQRFIPGAAPRPRYRHSPHPLVGVLHCSCGTTMRGRRTVWRHRERRWYVCSNQARYHSCNQKPVRAQELEDAFAAWLETCRPDERLERAARELLERGLRQRRIPASELDDRRRIKTLEDRLRRTGLVFRAGQMTEQEWQAETGAIRDDLARLKGRPHEPQTIRQASRRLTDLLAAWRDANPEERARLAASIVSEIQVTDGRISAIRPRTAWVAYFEQLLHDGAGDESRTRPGTISWASQPYTVIRPTLGTLC
ncbi:MAG: recombinase family protein [Candidatus Dormibacteraeota bacterium]|nr:recombinase family protein [Candidatus Dormibacteraeota bacterium]